VSAVQEVVDDVSAQESGGSGDGDMHGSLLEEVAALDAERFSFRYISCVL
jgi:hypothetical protein